MLKKILILIPIFYFLTLFQNTFLVHFAVWGIVLNFTLIFVIFINFFEKSQNDLGLSSALMGGFFLDIFSENFIGFWILIMLVVSIFIKLIFKKYVRTLPFFKK